MFLGGEDDSPVAPTLHPPPAITLAPDTERRIVTFVPPLLVGLLALPFVLHQNAWWEWVTAYWLLDRETAHVAAHGIPTFFLHTSAAAFYPHYVFYGGFVFSILAYPAAIVGAWPVFAATTVAALMAGYLGIWWAARNLGLSARLAVLPAATFATTPYVLTDLYGRGAWAELVAVNGAAVMLGGLTALLWHPQRRRAPALAALAASGAIVAGTHNLTLLMSAVALPLIVLALLPLAPRTAGLTGVAKQLGRSVVAIALGVGLTGVWLVPNLWLGPDTFISDPSISERLLRDNLEIVDLSNVLSPWPSAPPNRTGWLYAQPPVLAMVWALVALMAITWVRRRAPDRVVASAAGLLAVGTGLLLLIVDPLWWPSFPRIVQAVQLPVRLIPYLALVIALAIAVALTTLAGGRVRRLMTGALAVAVVAQAVMAVFIVLGTQAAAGRPVPLLRHGDVDVAGEPPSFSAPGLIGPWQFRVVHQPTGRDPKTPPVAAALRSITTSDTATLRGAAAVGQRITTGVVWSPLVRIDGDARLSGRTDDGKMIVTVTHTDGAGQWTATARSRCTVCLGALTGKDPWQLLAGRLLTLLSTIVLAGAAVVSLRRHRRARAGPPAPGPDPAPVALPADDAPARSPARAA
ncbi:MAG: 6-pyruvoyl-tetrahydropterin synthase related domain [Conexibacter sp.]|nr:6-pyruvoyl-tetrahydropterin synthase related domain [Conexibacter sp.]